MIVEPDYYAARRAVLVDGMVRDSWRSGFAAGIAVCAALPAIGGLVWWWL